MAALAQLNVRMNAQLKSRGDDELARLGISPTQLVRAVWMKIARGAEAIDQIISVLACEPAAASGMASDELAKVSQDAFEQRLQSFYREFDFNYTSYASPTNEEWENLLLQERLDRESERLVDYAK